jgi:hypothetical protein
MMGPVRFELAVLKLRAIMFLIRVELAVRMVEFRVNRWMGGVVSAYRQSVITGPDRRARRERISDE